MPSIKISKRTVDAAPVPERGDTYYWDTDLRGFGLRVTPKGVRSYVIQYRLSGRPARRLTLGIHGSPWTPETARTTAQDMLISVKRGSDPVEVTKQRAREARTLGFAAYVERFSEGCLQEEWKDSWKEAKRTLELHALPSLRGRSLPDIRPVDVKDVLEPLRPRKALARKVHAVLSRLFTWAVEEGDIPPSLNPMLGVKAPPKPKDRKRVLSPDEIVAVWKASYSLAHPFGSFIRLLICTLQRRCEVAGLPWEELDRLNLLWSVEGSRVKNEEDHLVPLNRLALDELDCLGWKQRGLVFTTTGSTPISGFSKMKAQLDRAMLPILQNLSDHRATELGQDSEPVQPPPWRLHDIRRTGTTVMQSLGIPVEHTEKCLNHKEGECSSGIRKVYNLWKYEAEKRRALDAWGAYLERLLTPSTDQNVVAFRTLETASA
jgi:integrase